MSETECISSAARKDRGFALLVVAGLFEPVWVVCMKLSRGFTDPLWAAATLAALFVSMYLLALALKCKVPMGTAYSIWVGIGAVGAVAAGIVLFNEPSDLIRLGFVALIIVGIVGVHLSARAEQ